MVAIFFVAVFPGNVWQLVNASDSFGLDTTTGRVVRLFFQPAARGLGAVVHRRLGLVARAACPPEPVAG